MAKIDRAIYSNRQLEAVMEDFWFNHFNVFAGKGRETLDADFLCARYDPAAHDGKISGFADRDGEKSRDAFLPR